MTSTKDSLSISFHKSNSNEYVRRVGGASFTLAKHLLEDITPAITSESIVLDNACGPAIVTELVKAQCPRASITAADYTPQMLDLVRQKVETHSWSHIKTDNLDMRDLRTLKDNTFSHSFTNLGLQALADDEDGPLKACKELYRVAQPQGVCTASIWSDRSFPQALKATARRVRSDQESINKMSLRPEWTTSSWLESLFKTAGFQGVVVKSCSTYNEAASWEDFMDNQLAFASFFFPDYSPEEMKTVEGYMREEFLRLPGFEIDAGTGAVKMQMFALLGFGWK